MSETMPSASPQEEQKPPEEASQFNALSANVDTQGRVQIRGVDTETGKKSNQLSHDEVLTSYGHPDYIAERNEYRAQNKEKETEYSGQKTGVDVLANGSEPTKEPRPIPVKEPKPTESAKNKHNLVPVNDDGSDKENDDGLPIAAMAVEPWKLEQVDGGAAEPPKPPSGPGETPGGGPGEVPPSGPGDVPPSEPGSGEIPPSGPGEPVPSDPTEDDPRKRIGEAVAKRMEELKASGMSESDAHAQAHDEFWGRSESEEEPTPGIPERLTSPELEAADVLVDVARTEYARMLAGQESSTFFSFKFSEKKVRAAKEAYDEAVANAGAVALGLFRERGVESADLAKANNWGAMEEQFKLISEQFDLEKNAVESKRLKGFYDWWQKQGTKLFSMGTIKKGAVMAAIGVPIGVGAAIIAAPIFAGAGVAAGAGLAVSRSVSKGLVGNAIRRNAEAGSVAEAKVIQRREDATALIMEFENNDRAVEQEYLGRMVTDRSKEVKHGNDKRAATSMVVAAGGAVLGYLAADWVGDHLPWGGPKPPPGAPKPPEVPYDPNPDRLRGIVNARPGAGEQAKNFLESIKPGTQPDADLSKVNSIFESVKGSLSPQQSTTYNEVVGHLSTTSGFGNSWSANHADQIFDLVKGGSDTNEIINTLGAGTSSIT